MILAEIILICGKICSGKTTFAEKLKSEQNAVILSCDEIMLGIFDEQLGERHEYVLTKVKKYLIKLSEQIIASETNVILDWGFWTASERNSVRRYYSERGINTKLYYVKVDDKLWEQRIEKRNSLNDKRSYFVDDNLISLMNDKFEEPDDALIVEI